MDSKNLWVELKPDNPTRMVLKGTYGEKVHKTFRVTRQGVRWRFQHIFGKIYCDAFSVILAIEKNFGTELREYAIRISKERYVIRREALTRGFQSADDTRQEWAYTFGLQFCRLCWWVFIGFYWVAKLCSRPFKHHKMR